MPFDPADHLVPMNIYPTRLEKAVFKAEAKRLNCTMMDVIRFGFDQIVARRKRAKQPMPRPVPVHKAKWREKARKQRVNGKASPAKVAPAKAAKKAA